MKKILLHTVIRHKYVGESVAIIIGECYSQCAPFLSGDAGALADIGKSSIAIVVIKNVGSGGEIFKGGISIENFPPRFSFVCVSLLLFGSQKKLHFLLFFIVRIERNRTPRPPPSA